MAFKYDAQNKKHNIVFIPESNFTIKNNSVKELIQNTEHVKLEI